MKVNVIEFPHDERLRAEGYLEGATDYGHEDIYVCGLFEYQGHWAVAIHDNTFFEPDDCCPCCGAQDSDEDTGSKDDQ